MKQKIIPAVVAALWLLPTISHGENIAQVHLSCGSLRFAQGHSSSGASLDFTTISPALNGELRPVFYENRTHATDVIFHSLAQTNLLQGSLALDVPYAADWDTNLNAVPDFYETALAVAPTNTSGEFSSPLGGGLVAALWSRDAGSATGSCLLTFTFTNSNDIETFDCQFTLIEYNGLLTYTPGSNSVSSAVSLHQTANPSSTFGGEMFFTKPLTNLNGYLTLEAGVWTNGIGQSISYPSGSVWHWFARAYWNSFYVQDGDPQTPESDYPLWLISIDDTNDYDLDGIPDIADDLYYPPRPPQLTYFQAEDGFYYFLLSGDVWRQHEFQESDSPESTNWQTIGTVTLMSDPQIFFAPLPDEPAKFWRAVVR